MLFAAVYFGSEPARPFKDEGAYTLRAATAPALVERLDKLYPLPPGEPPRLRSRIDAIAAEARASDPTSTTRDPATFRLPLGGAEDLHQARIGRPIFSATSIYAPTLVVTAAADGVVSPEHGEALMRDLTRAASKRAAVIPGATHVVAQTEARRGELFLTVETFLREPPPPAAR